MQTEEVVAIIQKHRLAILLLALFVLVSCWGYYMKSTEASKLAMAVVDLEEKSLGLLEELDQLYLEILYRDDQVANRLRELEEYFEGQVKKANTTVRPNIHPLPRGKVAYLTFDDGPLAATGKILDILKAHEVPATFFVNGRDSDYALKMYKRIVDEGHAIGNHTYSHEYDLVYSTVAGFISEVSKLQDFLYDTTGVKPQVFRFPGGSTNQINASPALMTVLTKEIQSMGLSYFDWNVSAGTATSTATAQTVYDNVISGIVGHRVANILFHDAWIVAEALPDIIEELKRHGYTFATLDKESYPVQYR